MADPITYSAVPTLYRCGSDFQELKVIIFKGPNDSKAWRGHSSERTKLHAKPVA